MELKVITEPRIHQLRVASLVDDGVHSFNCKVPIGVVVSIESQGAGSVLNSRPASYLGELAAGEPGCERLALPDDKARRLIDFFRSMHPGHPFECHDFVTEVEGWDGNGGLDGVQSFVPEDGGVSPSRPHGVFVNPSGGNTAQHWMRTHSAMSTESQNFLAVLGRGLSLAVMDRATMLDVYSRGCSDSGIFETQAN